MEIIGPQRLKPSYLQILTARLKACPYKNLSRGPQRLKPLDLQNLNGTPEGVPLQRHICQAKWRELRWWKVGRDSSLRSE